MVRFCITGAVVCALVVIVTSIIGLAIDREIQQRVIYTRAGVTLDCERVVGPHGHVYYRDCSRIP